MLGLGGVWELCLDVPDLVVSHSSSIVPLDTNLQVC